MNNLINNRLLSVIVPIYNVEKYLIECLESIKKQTYSNLEIILVNDGSTDNSKNIAQEFVKNDSRFKLLNKENGGLVSAYVEGIKQATGDFITFVDSDDYLDLTMYEECMEKFTENIDLVASSYYYSTNGKLIKVNTPLKDGVYHAKDVMCFGGINKNYFSAARWSKIFKSYYVKQIVDKLDPNLSLYEDYVFTNLYFALIDSFYFFDKPLYYYRQVNGSITKKWKNFYVDQPKIIYEVYVKHFSRSFDQYIYDDVLRAYYIILKILFKSNLEFKEVKLVRKKIFNDVLFKKCYKLGKWPCHNFKQYLDKFLMMYVPNMYCLLIRLVLWIKRSH